MEHAAIGIRGILHRYTRTLVCPVSPAFTSLMVVVAITNQQVELQRTIQPAKCMW